MGNPDLWPRALYPQGPAVKPPRRAPLRYRLEALPIEWATASEALVQPLEAHTVAQLRQMARAAGHKQLARSGRRQQLLEVLA